MIQTGTGAEIRQAKMEKNTFIFCENTGKIIYFLASYTFKEVNRSFFVLIKDLFQGRGDLKQN
jgi:hypothetical protein